MRTPSTLRDLRTPAAAAFEKDDPGPQPPPVSETTAPNRCGEPRPARRNPAPLPDPELRERRARQRILVAEDNLLNQRVVGAVLERSGWDFTFADNGQEALERLSAEHYDLVLMDCQMPVLDGLSATRRIREAEKDRHIPIVALTANAFASDRKACFEAGMDEFIAKPFQAAQLVATLDRLLAA